MTREFRALYHDNVMVEMVRMGPADRVAIRKARSLMALDASPTTVRTQLWVINTELMSDGNAVQYV